MEAQLIYMGKFYSFILYSLVNRPKNYLFNQGSGYL